MTEPRGIDRLREMLANRPPMSADLGPRRAGFEAMMARMWDVSHLAVTETDGGAWVDAPGVRQDRAVIYLHGGAFMLGSSASYAGLAGLIGAAADARVLVLDYPLAPEHPFPAAPDAVLAAWDRLTSAGMDPAALALAGDSAGANLAIGAALALKGRGPAAVGCISAYLDMTHTRPSIRERAPRDPFVSLDTLDVPRRAYAPDTDPRDPRLSPIFGDLSNLPPILLMVGEDEAFHDDSVDFAALAQEAGSPAEVEIWPEMIHVWPIFAPILDEGRAAAQRLGAFLGGHLR
jgi:acetyl esterase/lipase